MTNMLSLFNHQRLSIADIAGHPWMQGELPTHEEVKKELVDRLESVKKQREAEAAQRKSAKIQKALTKGTKRGSNSPHKPQQSSEIGFEETKQEDITDDPRQLDNFDD